MEQKSMTALVSAFSRAYHSKNNEVKIFNDHVAPLLLTEHEYSEIAKSMAQGIQFFNPGFLGSEADALRWVVDHQLSPTPLGRAAFAEQSLENAVFIGARQYLIFAAGYDSFANRQPDWAGKLQLFELDHPLMSMEKQERIHRVFGKNPDNLTYLAADLSATRIDEKLFSNTTYNKDVLTFSSLLGISYYLSKESFKRLIGDLSNMVRAGSTLVFDYPDQDAYTENGGERSRKQAMLAANAGEAMLASYSYKEMESLLSEHGFLIYEHLEPEEITKQYFETYNRANPLHPMSAFDNVNYCLAVKK